MKKQLENIINKRLQVTRNCKFKNAWIPKGWTCVHIKTFSSELAANLLAEQKKAKLSMTDYQMFDVIKKNETKKNEANNKTKKQRRG